MSSHPPSHRSSRGRVLVGLLVGLLVVGSVAALGLGLHSRGDDVPPRGVRPPVADERVPVALRTLHAWDRRRAEAYAAGSPSRLADLYVAGSSAGTRDVRVLRGYRSRGLRVTGLRMQLLAVSVVERRPDRWRLRVTDRLAGGAAVQGSRTRRLPRDTASSRVLTLLRGGDHRWRVSAVLPDVVGAGATPRRRGVS